MQMKFIDGQCKFSQVFNFAIIGYSQNLRKLDAQEKLVFYSNFTVRCRIPSFCNHGNKGQSRAHLSDTVKLLAHVKSTVWCKTLYNVFYINWAFCVNIHKFLLPWQQAVAMVATPCYHGNPFEDTIKLADTVWSGASICDITVTHAELYLINIYCYRAMLAQSAVMRQ